MKIRKKFECDLCGCEVDRGHSYIDDVMGEDGRTEKRHRRSCEICYVTAVGGFFGSHPAYDWGFIALARLMVQCTHLLLKEIRKR